MQGAPQHLAHLGSPDASTSRSARTDEVTDFAKRTVQSFPLPSLPYLSSAAPTRSSSLRWKVQGGVTGSCAGSLPTPHPSFCKAAWVGGWGCLWIALEMGGKFFSYQGIESYGFRVLPCDVRWRSRWNCHSVKRCLCLHAQSKSVWVLLVCVASANNYCLEISSI